jgi:hypothetical protein
MQRYSALTLWNAKRLQRTASSIAFGQLPTPPPASVTANHLVPSVRAVPPAFNLFLRDKLLEAKFRTLPPLVRGREIAKQWRALPPSARREYHVRAKMYSIQRDTAHTQGL